uniref:Uncharacterized protein n=1 Tax=Tanacetum cinerariifolium TaxID=118510 RepID=A0A699J738_TANCI|nr:hypothetical protein [Tanacetum cinerariifolium]
MLERISKPVLHVLLVYKNKVGDRSYSSHGVDFADNVSFDGMGSPRKEKTVVLDFQNSTVSLPFGKHTMGVSSFHSGYGKGHMVLYFENSAVRLPSAKEDMFNGGGWFGLDAITRFYRADPYSCLFRQSGSVETQGECSSSSSQVKKGYAYGCSSLQEDIETHNVAFSGLSCEAPCCFG